MSQAAVILPGSPLTGAAAAADINAAWGAQISLFSGATAPTLGPGASGALVEGQDWLDTSQSVHVWKKWDGTQWNAFAAIDPTGHAAFAALPWRNILGDNGGLEVWQRGAGSGSSFSLAASATAYTADRWYLQDGANQAATVAAVAGLTNQSNLAAKITRNSGQTGTGIMIFAFPLDTDEIVRMRGRLVSLSFVAKTGANWSPASGSLSYALFTGTGAVGKRGLGAYTNEVLVISNSTNIAVNTQVNILSTSAAVLPTNTTQAEVGIFWTPVGTAGADDSITVDDVQLEVGGPTLFERTPFERSLVGCKRHFWKTFGYSIAPAQNVGQATNEAFGVAGKAGALTEFLWVKYPVSMRANPSITTFNPAAANAQVRDETAGVDCSATTLINSGAEIIALQATGNGGGTPTAVGNLLGIHLTADAGI